MHERVRSGLERAATRVIPPFVVQENGNLTGFSIDLWKDIAEKLQLKTDYVMTSDVGELLDAVKNGKADLGVGATSITSDRDKDYDFSQPFLEAGLQVMVRGKGDDGPDSPLQGLVRILFSPAILVWLGIAILLILIPAHIVWVVERKHPAGIVPQTGYFPGIFHAMWWAASCLATQAENMPRSAVARVLAVLWMFTAVVFVAYFTAQLTASLTVQRMQGSINGPDDLPGKTVATTKGSTSVKYLHGHGIQVQEYAQIDEAYKALLDKRADAVVFDSPALRYFESHDGKGQVQVVGSIFRKENYGIVLPPNSPYRKPIDRALLSLREDGTYEQLYKKWFGQK